MIIDRYDLEEGKLTKEIIREIKLLAEIVCDDRFKVLELKFCVKKIGYC